MCIILVSQQLFSNFKLSQSVEMIRAVLVFNNQGKARLVKFFEHYVSAASLAMGDS